MALFDIFRKASPPPVAFVRLHSDAQPRTPEERVIYNIVRTHEVMEIQALVEQVALHMECEECRRGAAALDIGIWGPTIYRREARRVLATVQGRLLEIEPARVTDKEQ